MIRVRNEGVNSMVKVKSEMGRRRMESRMFRSKGDKENAQ